MAKKNKEENKKHSPSDQNRIPSCNTFGYEDLHQVDPKYVGTVNPDYNPGVFSRIKSKGNIARTYIVKKPLYYYFHESTDKTHLKSTKINIQVGEKIYFSKERHIIQ